MNKKLIVLGIVTLFLITSYISFFPTVLGKNINKNKSDVKTTSNNLGFLKLDPIFLYYEDTKVGGYDSRCVSINNNHPYSTAHIHIYLSGKDKEHFKIKPNGLEYIDIDPGWGHDITIWFEPKSEGYKQAYFEVDAEEPFNDCTGHLTGLAIKKCNIGNKFCLSNYNIINTQILRFFDNPNFFTLFKQLLKLN